MILTHTPCRVSFTSGGSDIASFYEKHDGCVLNKAISKYIYTSIHLIFSKQETVLKYSKTETVSGVAQVESEKNQIGDISAPP